MNPEDLIYEPIRRGPAEDGVEQRYRIFLKNVPDTRSESYSLTYTRARALTIVQTDPDLYIMVPVE